MHRNIVNGILTLIFYVFLITLGIVLQFLPITSFLPLFMVYTVAIFLLSFYPYRNTKIIEITDFLLSFLVFTFVYLLLHNEFNVNQWFYITFSIILATTCYGCNQRFKQAVL